MSFYNYNISSNLNLVKYLHEEAQPAKVAAPVVIPTNHIVVLDCSGSMSYELTLIKDQLKRKLPKLVGEKDTLSIIWFSGKGEFGVLVEGEPVSTLVDLAEVNKSIDRWLRPIGLTGFKEPIEEAVRVVERLKKKNPGSLFSLFFLSDGYDNTWQRKQILDAVDAAAGSFSAATVVEYGYYADRPFLTTMAEKLGGALIFSESFDKYAPLFESAMGKKVVGAKKVEYKVGDVVGNVAFATYEGDILTFAVENGVVRVPENIKTFGFLAPSSVGSSEAELVKNRGDEEAVSLAYSAVALFSSRMKPEVVLPLLKALGDVTYIEQFSSCFGKQKYSEFQDSVKVAAFDKTARLTKGFDPTKVPNDNAFTVLELLQVLAQDEGNRLLLDHEKFQYNRIGRSRVDASQMLTQEEQDEIDCLTQQMIGERDSTKVAQYAKIISDITNKPAPLKFEALAGEEGYPLKALTYAEERPNVSLRVQKHGVVDISSRCPAEYASLLPQKFPTYIYRNYSIIKDGLVNVKFLPCKVTESTLSNLRCLGLPEEAFSYLEGSPSLAFGCDQFVIFDLSKLPVINRRMVQVTSAKNLFELEWELTNIRAAQKVFKNYTEALLGKKESTTFSKAYSKEAAQWLADQGITDFNGFNPKSVATKPTDKYMGKELNVKIKSFSSLPAVEATKKKVQEKGEAKLTPSEALIYKYVKYVEDFLNAGTSETQKRMLETWLQDETQEAIRKARELSFKKAQILFSIVVGQSWFSDFETLDEHNLDLFIDSTKLACSVEQTEIEIEI